MTVVLLGKPWIHPPRCNLQSNGNSEDKTSQLPDEILVDVLSFLPVKELGQSSVLSKRWRDLWKSTARLNFDAPEALKKVRRTKTETPKIALGPARFKYVTWVNHVLKLHERPSLEEFRVKFDLAASYSKDIDEWIKLVILKRTKNIEIDLASFFYGDDYAPSQECLNYLKSASNLPNIVCIRSLSLGQVNIDEELVEYLLSVCPHLERLSLSRSSHLRKLKVAGPSLSLKYLKIHSCGLLESIELCAPKLKTFVYYGARVNFVIGNIPLLSELHIEGSYYLSVVVMGNYLGQFSRYFSQLETLSLGMLLQNFSDLPEVGELRNLKHLMLDIGVAYYVSSSLLKMFIMAAPSLTKLTVKLSMNFPWYMQEPLMEPHDHLKELEVIGYTGTSSMFEFVEYLIKISINLENVMLDPRHPRGTYRSPKQIKKDAKQVRDDADQLKDSLPPGAKLIARV